MRTSLRGIANKARLDKKHRFRNLFGLLNEEGLESGWQLLNKKAASGVDGVTDREYAEDLAGNISRLVDRVKHGKYRAQLVKRKHIPKDGKGTRPLGIPVLEDKLLQKGVARILEAIFEADFLPCSWAYRPRRNALGAVRTLTQELQFGCYGYVIEVDIKSFFDNIDHKWMMRMLEERIDDKPFLRLIRKWLKAGVLEEDGRVRHPLTGCPQGGVVSPVLANIYLHYVLDLWFERRVRPNTMKRAFMCRYADDMVFAFQLRWEAERFHRELIKRLAKFGLEVSVEKTRILRFSRFQLGKKAKAFEFLGIAFRWMKDRSGTPRVKRRTAPKRLRRALARMTEWCKVHRIRKLGMIMASFNRKLLGHFNYYGIRTNYESLLAFYKQSKQILWKWLNRRSQRRSYNWHKFNILIRRFRIARPLIRADRYIQLDLLGEAY
jgi:group II intron reverse transcriptase/maturase